MKTPSRLRRHARTVAVTVCIWSMQWSSLAVAADLSQDMAQMFQDVGAVSTSTSPGPYRSQTMNIYSFGELQMRVPTRHFQNFVNFTPPSIRAGCGGIDAYLGSISHINSAQFKAMLQQIGANTVGALFKIALKSIQPMIESTLDGLQKDIDFLNSFNKGSCEAAQNLVAGMIGQIEGEAMSSCVKAARAQYGIDVADARQKCMDSPEAVNTDAANSSSPEVKEMAQRDINVVWDALGASSFSGDEKEIFMNISGSWIFKKPLNNGGTPEPPQEVASIVDNLNTLLFGNQPGSSDDRVVINGWWSCTDADCLSPTQGLKEITPFPVLVMGKLTAIRDKLASRQELSPSEQSFISSVTVPVYRMMVLGYASGTDSGISDMLINRYAQLIAYDYAHTYLQRMLKEVLVYMGKANLKSSVEDGKRDDLRRKVEGLLTQIGNERSRAESRVQNMNAMVDDLMRIERQMLGNMPPSMQNMQQFSNLMTGKG